MKTDTQTASERRKDNEASPHFGGYVKLQLEGEPAPNKAQHSPLPWNIGEDNDVFSANTDCVARVCGAPEGIKGDIANSRLIVRAVNGYAEALLMAEALRTIRDRSESEYSDDYQTANEALIKWERSQQ